MLQGNSENHNVQSYYEIQNQVGTNIRSVTDSEVNIMMESLSGDGCGQTEEI